MTFEQSIFFKHGIAKIIKKKKVLRLCLQNINEMIFYILFYSIIIIVL